MTTPNDTEMRETDHHHTPAKLGIDSIAASAYRAYAWNRDWKTYDNKPMPEWDKLSAPIQMAWMCAAQQTIEVVTGGSYGLGIEQKWAGAAFNGVEVFPV